MKSDYVSLWYTQFRKLRASKGSDLLLCNDTEFDLHLVILNTLHWHLPFHSTLVTRGRRPYLGHDNWSCATCFSHYKVPLTFRHSWKRLRKLRSKNLIKFPQVYIAFVLQCAHCFEKYNTYWLNESWETRLPKRLKCTIGQVLNQRVVFTERCVGSHAVLLISWVNNSDRRRRLDVGATDLNRPLSANRI